MALIIPLLQFGCAATTYDIRGPHLAMTIDGNIDTNEWQTAVAAMPVQVICDAGGEKTSIRVLYDKEWIYIGIECLDSGITERQDDFWKNDSIRIGVTSGIAETEDFCRFVFTIIPQGLVAARFHKGKTPPMLELIDDTVLLEPRHYKVACLAGQGKWSAELALSWAAFASATVPPKNFGLSVERRNINGAKIEVADWPYDKQIGFRFELKSGEPQ